MRAAGLFVVLIALGANAWVLRLDFQWDDYELIPKTGWLLGVAPAPEIDPWLVANPSYSFRPVLWATLWLLLKASGGHAVASAFHALFLAAHAGAALLLYRTLAARLASGPAFIGAALFAILPGGIQAVSWIAAGGDQLAVLFILAALAFGDRWLRRRAPGALAGCAAAAFCAVGSKESAVALLPALGLAWLLLPREARRDARPGIRQTAVARLQSAGPQAARPAPAQSAALVQRARFSLGRVAALSAVAALGAAAAWAMRARALGTWQPRYWSGVEADTSHLAMLGRALAGFVAPWSVDTRVGDASPATFTALRAVGAGNPLASTALVWIAAAAAALPVVLALVAGSGRGRLVLGALLALLVVAVAPILPIMSADGLGLSRAFYPAAAVFAALVAASCAALGGGARAALAVAPLFLVSADLLVCIARSELAVARLIGTARSDLDRLVAARGATQLVLIEPPPQVARIPFLGGVANAAAAPPFGAAKAPRKWWSAATLPRCPAVSQERSRLQFLEWNGAHIALRGPELAPIAEEIPALDPAEGAARSFRPGRPVPARAVAGVRIEVAPAGVTAGTVTWAAGDRSIAMRFDAGAPGPHVVSVPDDAFDEDWFGRPHLDEVRIEGPSLAAPPVLLRELPTISVSEPQPDADLDLASPPRIRFSCSAAAQSFRFTLTAMVDGRWVDLVWLVPSSAAPAGPDGRREIVASGPGFLRVDGRHSGASDWASAAALLASQNRARSWVMPIGLLVEAVDAGGVNAVAAAPWIRLSLVRH